MKTKAFKISAIAVMSIALLFLAIGMSFCFNIWGNGVQNGQIHLSVDDTIDIFQDLTENQEQYDSIFDHTTLNFFRECHDKFNAKFSMYCFYESGDFNLSMVPDKYQSEFLENSDWLKFGFHYKNENEPGAITAEAIVTDYQQLTTELLRITGSISSTIRLSYFKGSYDVVCALKKQGINCLLTADDDRQSYYFDQEVNSYIRDNDSYYDSSNGMNFVSTDLRLENIRTIMVYPELIKISMDDRQNKIIAVFTHEWIMNERMFDKIELTCKFAKNYDYSFTLLE